MFSPKHSILIFAATSCLLIPFGVQSAFASAPLPLSNLRAVTTSKKMLIKYPDGRPASGAQIFRRAIFSGTKPKFISPDTNGEGPEAPKIIAGKDGKITWDKPDGTVWIVSPDQKHAVACAASKLPAEITLQKLIRIQGRFENPQAKKYNLPFLRRSYIYLEDGTRVAHVVGSDATIFLPEGTYGHRGYDGNPTNVLTNVPHFQIKFTVKAGEIPVVDTAGQPITHLPDTASADGDTVNLGTFHYGKGKIAFESDTLNPLYEGDYTLTFDLTGVDGKPYRGKQIVVKDTEARNTYIYYGKMTSPGKLIIKGVDEGVYRLEVDGHSPYGPERNGSKIIIDENFKNEPLSFNLPVLPGYTLDTLHMLDPKTLEPRNLDAYKGKVMYIEFWASSCKPCIQAMNHMEEVLPKYRDKWGDSVALVALNVDANPVQVIKQHEEMYGWKLFQHLYGGDKGKEKANWGAPALQQMQIRGLPHALIIGPDGKMHWRGHPESVKVERVIQELLDQFKSI